MQVIFPTLMNEQMLMHTWFLICPTCRSLSPKAAAAARVS